MTSLIDACARISPGIPLRGRTMATLIGLLASSGLRSGEVVRLDRSDVDLTNGVLLVRKTKFRKDRLVPVHTTTQAALRHYAHDRDAAFPTPKDQGFFLSSRGNRLSATGLQNGFAEVRKLAGLDGGKPLRPHDLRHRFAVTRLSFWHQQRADVQALLPLLATYLGHASYSDTAYYLTGSADLLACCGPRFPRWRCSMSEHLLLAPLLESYFRRRLTKQRNATPATVASYRDALRMLILFAAAKLRKRPAALVLEDLDRDLVLAFLDELEEKRNNTVATRNARLAAIRSFFHHVAAADPASFGVAQRVLTIPTKRAHIEVTHHLTKAEVDAVIAAPDQRTPRGRRDRAFLLFLARTGARVSEAIGVNADDLQLDRPRSQVLLHGKGRRDRVIPVPQDLARALAALLRECGIANHKPRPIFIGAHNERLTRFGATHIVRRAAAKAVAIRPNLAEKPISPHIFRHSLAMKLLQSGVDLLTIQAWLGHAQVATTHRYAAADVEMMRNGLEKAGIEGDYGTRFRPTDAVLQLLNSI
nr:tyrosine-type recombinase/integrase [Sinorhizobium meliloti]